MYETIPLQILDPFTELFEVGHTFSAHGSNAQIVVSAFVNRNSRLQVLARRDILQCRANLVANAG